MPRFNSRLQGNCVARCTRCLCNVKTARTCRKDISLFTFSHSLSFDDFLAHCRYPLTNVYDSLCEFDDALLARELAAPENNTRAAAAAVDLDSIFENHYEQFSQLKGTLQLEKSDTQHEMFMYGSRVKSFAHDVNGVEDAHTATRMLVYAKVIAICLTLCQGHRVCMCVYYLTRISYARK